MGTMILVTHCTRVGRTDEAIASYRRAVDLSPRSPEAHSNLGRVLCGLRQFEEAAACCQRAIDLDPGSPIAHNNLGNALRELGRLAEAEASYRRSLALKPDYLEALINLGSILGDLGRWAEAKSAHRLAIQIHPNSGVALNALGRMLSRLAEDDEEAERCLKQAIALQRLRQQYLCRTRQHPDAQAADRCCPRHVPARSGTAATHHLACQSGESRVFGGVPGYADGRLNPGHLSGWQSLL